MNVLIRRKGGKNYKRSNDYFQNDAEAAREAYEKFLERYPYCYGYWRKYADYEKKKGNPENVQKVSKFLIDKFNIKITTT